MKRRHQEEKIVTRVVGGAAILGAAYFALRSMPELVRYLRIRRM